MRRKQYDVSNVGFYIKERRKSRNITIKKLSDFTGISVPTIKRIENGQCLPSLENFAKLCEFLILDMNRICSKRDQK